ncbi:hypothetical protein ACJZ2D_007491 [Fusarium nematophilum]
MFGIAPHRFGPSTLGSHATNLRPRNTTARNSGMVGHQCIGPFWSGIFDILERIRSMASLFQLRQRTNATEFILDAITSEAWLTPVDAVLSSEGIVLLRIENGDWGYQNRLIVENL